MEGSIIKVSKEQILAFLTKVLESFKKLMAWLGILVLPEDGEYDYPTQSTTEDPAIGA